MSLSTETRFECSLNWKRGERDCSLVGRGSNYHLGTQIKTFRSRGIEVVDEGESVKGRRSVRSGCCGGERRRSIECRSARATR